MRRRATWLVMAAVGAVVVVGVVDSVRGSSSTKATGAGESVIVPSSTMVLPEQTATAALSPTEPAVPTEPVAAAASAPLEQLPSCARQQLQLTFTRGGAAAALLRRVQGPACHHGRASIAVSVHDLSGDQVAVFGASSAARPADFSHGFEQLLELPAMSCDPNGTFLVVATVDSYVARGSLPGSRLPCNHD